jgi:predicted anti-sigma-YlaC factor YlaD
MVHSVAAPRHYVPPSGRELRAQAVHRLQIGLAGLAGMLLLVGLANIIMNRAQLVSGGQSDAAAAAKSASGSDPLADIGVAPAAVSSGTEASKKSAR